MRHMFILVARRVQTFAVIFMTFTVIKLCDAGPRYSSRIVDTRGGDIRGIILELNSRHLEPVEVFRGIPYAAPPIDDLRYRLPQPAIRWSGTKLADTFGAVCPQKYPDVSNRTAALQFMPRGRYHYLKKFVPHLYNQSEDCLFLNLYIPGSGNRGLEAPYAVMVYVHGESFEWGSGNPYDGSVLASYGHVIVVTLNYRLGILGFLKTTSGLGIPRNGTMSSGGNLALYDIAAALRWIRDNIAAFGGDPTRVTLIGHDTGAALVNLLLISTIAKGLFTRVVLLSGSALSPWATIHNAETVRQSVARQYGCVVSIPRPNILTTTQVPSQIVPTIVTNSSSSSFTSASASASSSSSTSSTPSVAAASASLPTSSSSTTSARSEVKVLDDIAPCLRKIPLQALLDVQLDTARFMPRIAPFLPVDASTLDAAYAMEHSSESFITCELMLGVTTTESYSDFNAEEIQYGFEEDQRNRILRTYIRNAYVYHLNEIFSAVRNEYTDWDKPIQHPINIRDSTMEALSDGHTVSPLIRVAYLHARRGAKTYFFHFGYQTKDSDYPQRLGSIRGEDLIYIFGMPLVGGLPYFPQNFSRQDMGVAEGVLNFFTNFAKSGDPNEPREHKNDYGTMKEKTRYRDMVWETYEIGTQQYISITLKPRIKSHYRGHKMAVWLNLIPQLHQPGDDDVSMRHHHFHEREPHYYAGAVRPESFTRLPPPLRPSSMTDARHGGSGSSSGSTECVPNTTNDLEMISDDMDESLITDDTTESDGDDDDDDAQLLERFASRHYYSYTAALGVTVGVGCLLLLLNMLIFAGIYYQRGRDRRKRHNQNSNMMNMSTSSESIQMSQRPTTMLNNQQPQQTPPSPTIITGAHVIKVHEPPPCYATVNKITNNRISIDTQSLPSQQLTNTLKPNKCIKSKNIEKPKPPVRTSSVPVSPPTAPSSPTTNLTIETNESGTNTIKKRVQIQEISV